MFMLTNLKNRFFEIEKSIFKKNIKMLITKTRLI